MLEFGLQDRGRVRPSPKRRRGGTQAVSRRHNGHGLPRLSTRAAVCLSVFKLATQAAQYCCTNRVYVTSKAASGAAGCGVGEKSIACVSRYLAVKAELSRGQVEASGFERWFGERGQRAASFPLAIRAPRLLLP